MKFAQFIGRIQRLVRFTNKDGKMEIEEGIIGHVITLDYFKQEYLYKEFKTPKIAEEENESLDADYEEEEANDTMDQLRHERSLHSKEP